MIIEHTKTSPSTVTLRLCGRLDTVNAPLLEQKINECAAVVAVSDGAAAAVADGDAITELILDLTKLTYISSMGLRVLLQAKKTFKGEGRKLAIENIGGAVREVLEITGLLTLMAE